MPRQMTRPAPMPRAWHKHMKRERGTVQAVGSVERWADVPRNQVLCMDALEMAKRMPSESVQCIVTSPPYFGLRDYGVEGQMGLEETPEQYVAGMVELFRELRRVLRKDGTLWLNIGDSYVSSATGSDTKKSTLGGGKKNQSEAAKRPDKSKSGKSKDLLGIPWRVALALQADGWYLRSDIIWAKPNPMPESVTDRPTKAHEYVFLLTKSERYYYDAEAIKEPASEAGREYSFTTPAKVARAVTGKQSGNEVNGKFVSYETRNKRSVWTIGTEPTPFAHFATFPTKLIEPMILAGSQIGEIVYDPFMGSFTTAVIARSLGRGFCGSELNPSYMTIGNQRLSQPYTPPLFQAQPSAGEATTSPAAQQSLWEVRS